MEYAKYTLRIEGLAGPDEAGRIAGALAGAGLAGREDAFHAYAFDRDYEEDQDGMIRFANAGEVKDEPEVVGELRMISDRHPHALFVLDGHIPVEGEDDRFRVYFKGGRAQYAETTVVYEPFDEAKLD